MLAQLHLAGQISQLVVQFQQPGFHDGISFQVNLNEIVQRDAIGVICLQFVQKFRRDIAIVQLAVLELVQLIEHLNQLAGCYQLVRGDLRLKQRKFTFQALNDLLLRLHWCDAILPVIYSGSEINRQFIE